MNESVGNNSMTVYMILDPYSSSEKTHRKPGRTYPLDFGAKTKCTTMFPTLLRCDSLRLSRRTRQASFRGYAEQYLCHFPVFEGEYQPFVH